MAQATALLTYDQYGNREDLLDIVTNITPTDTPMLSDFKKTKATARYHEWVTDTLASAAANAQIEGADYSFSKVASRSRTGGYTQILTKLVEVSGTQDAVDKAGVDSEYAYQMEKKLKEIARDAEYAIVQNTGNSGASGTARTLKGVLSWITTNVTTGTGTGTETLTETMYNDSLQLAYAQGGNPDTTYCNSWQKRKISGFTASTTRNIDAGAKKLIASIDVYESDFGVQAIKLDRFMDTDKIVQLQKDMWATAWLRPFKSEEVAKIGDAMRGSIIGEFTLEALNEAASAKITELATS